MIGAIVGLFNVVRGMFVGGGLVATVLGGVWSGIASLLAVVGSLGSLLLGGIAVFGQMWAYVASYHAIELIRRFFLITFIVFILGFIIDYLFTNIIVHNGKSISLLFNSLIESIVHMVQLVTTF